MSLSIELQSFIIGIVTGIFLTLVAKLIDDWRRSKKKMKEIKAEAVKTA